VNISESVGMVEAQILGLKRIVEQELEETKKRLSELDEESNTLDKMIDIYRRRIGSNYAKSVSNIEHKDFNNKSLREVLQYIAKLNNNTLVVKEAVKLMKGANLFGNPANAASVVYSILKRSPEFSRIGTGTFRLLSKIEMLKPLPDIATASPIRSSLHNPISFEKAIIKVLQDANGESLRGDEIWKRMQGLGVKSNSKNPVGWVNRIASIIGAEKVGPKIWRWKASQIPEQKPLNLPAQTLTSEQTFIFPSIEQKSQ